MKYLHGELFEFKRQDERKDKVSLIIKLTQLAGCSCFLSGC